jgi:hypothetical protein
MLRQPTAVQAEAAQILPFDFELPTVRAQLDESGDPGFTRAMSAQRSATATRAKPWRAMAPYIDTTLRPRLRDAEDEAGETVNEAWGEAIAAAEFDLDEIRRDAAAAAIKPYRQRLAELGKAVEQDLEPVRERWDALREQVEAVVEDFDVDLPERPEPEVDRPKESDWLFDSARDDLEQLRHYKARK